MFYLNNASIKFSIYHQRLVIKVHKLLFIEFSLDAAFPTVSQQSHYSKLPFPFVPKDVAIKMNFILKRILNRQNDIYGRICFILIFS